MRLFQVDAFTAVPFSGNPAGVCLLDRAAKPDWMQKLALEMNLSETAFVWPRTGGFEIRFFTPAVEVPLCGHATLASAHILYECGIQPRSSKIEFQAPAGRLTTRFEDDWIVMDFPAFGVTPCADREVVEEILGVKPTAVFKSENGWHVAEMASTEEVVRVKPDLRRLLQSAVQELLVTGPGATTEVDFVSRFFAPRAGIDEDPVTGSAHCILTPFWSAKLGKSRMNARQVSARGGVLRVESHPDRKRVLIEGQAVTLFRIELTDHVPPP